MTYKLISRVSPPYGRGEANELSAWATADIKHDIVGLRIEEIQDRPHALPAAWIPVR
jgi:hypothetical protein